MPHETTTELNLSYEQFSKLDYKSRVIWYDKTFNIIKYVFPACDADISWFFDEGSTLKLCNIYYHEMHHNNMSKRVSIDETESVRFDIRPSSRQQRIFLNDYLMSHFQASNQHFHAAFERQVESAVDKIKFLNARIDKVLTTVDWMTIELGKKQKLSLKIKFLAIVYNGYIAFKYKNDKMITKRKLTELFLFNQGMLLAAHLEIIEKSIFKEQLSISSRF